MIRLYMGAVYSVCGSATMTLASDLLPRNMITPGINRFAFTVSIGMALGPFIGIQVQNNMHSQASFICVFILSLCALAALLFAGLNIRKSNGNAFLSGTLSINRHTLL